MRNQTTASIPGFLFAALIAASPALQAQEKVQGKVTSTKLTACDMDRNGGGCEGYMTLEPTAGNQEKMKIFVRKGTQINKGAKHVFLPDVRGNLVDVSYVQDQGEKLAKVIDVLPKK